MFWSSTSPEQPHYPETLVSIQSPASMLANSSACDRPTRISHHQNNSLNFLLYKSSGDSVLVMRITRTSPSLDAEIVTSQKF
ncbi:MAG: hypothetical protein EBE86_020635 [Hormoscilla sp. GUM202]|nr:hypothetical protein [Hormoscilla sp. GUM202]